MNEDCPVTFQRGCRVAGPRCRHDSADDKPPQFSCIDLDLKVIGSRVIATDMEQGEMKIGNGNLVRWHVGRAD